MYLALSTYVLLILLMQSENGAQFWNTASILLFPQSATNSVTVIVSPANICHHDNHINVTLLMKF